MTMKIRSERPIADVGFFDGCEITSIPHLHREVEVICLFEGRMIAYADSARYVLEGGDIFVAFPNQIHSYEGVENKACIGLAFQPDLLPEMAEVFSAGFPRAPVVKRGLYRQNLRSLVDALVGTRDRDGFAHLSDLRRGYVLALFSELLPSLSVERLHPSDSESLRAIVSFCTRNYNENLSLSLLEEKLHLNKFYISHLFSGKLGLRFNDYINSLRVFEACRYLADSDEPITHISARVGFNTPRTFNRAFIKQMGVSPSDYRRGLTQER